MAKSAKSLKSKAKSMRVTPVRATRSGKKITEARKTFQQDGHWIIKPRKTPIEMCSCGNRYIKTRPSQKVCLRCLYAPAPARE